MRTACEQIGLVTTDADVPELSVDNGSKKSDEDNVKATTAVRRRWILDRLQEQDFVSVKELADEFEMTEISLRRDLNALAEKGHIVRVRGGARRSRTAAASRRYAEEDQLNAQAKARIARAAAALLRGERTAFFYSGSTVARVAVALGDAERASLTIVTPSLPVITEASSWADPHLVVVGGLFLPNYLACVGPQAVESLRAISADVAVVGCDGLTAADGLTTPHQLVAEIGSVIVERARKTVVVADSSKIGRRGFTPIAPTSAIQTLVTDEGADPTELKALRDRGVEVHTV
jgi:DeoR/GlpR family transcriptional regulator of sugar metabolism